MAYHVSRAEASGTRRILGAPEGSVHLEVLLAELGPGAAVETHVHPFEESFWVLDGRALLTVAGATYRLQAGDYGYAPVAAPHGWRNPFDEPVRCLLVRAPQPRGRDMPERLPAPGEPPGDGVEPRPSDPRQRHVGRFQEADLPPPSPISMRSYRGSGVQKIQLRYLLDDLSGAVHHHLFLVQFPPAREGSRADQHFHPFEEIYYLLGGRALAHLEDEVIEVGAGDLVWTGVGCAHGYTVIGDEPVRWLEVQSPPPPPSPASQLFAHDWRPDGS